MAWFLLLGLDESGLAMRFVMEVVDTRGGGIGVSSSSSSGSFSLTRQRRVIKPGSFSRAVHNIRPLGNPAMCQKLSKPGSNPMAKEMTISTRWIIRTFFGAT